MQTVANLIDKLGGTVAVAKALGLTASTVSSWKTANSIPNWRMDGVQHLAVKKGIKVPASLIQRNAAA